jgi:GNAT superfamily N-acetyltransferase
MLQSNFAATVSKTSLRRITAPTARELDLWQEYLTFAANCRGGEALLDLYPSTDLAVIAGEREVLAIECEEEVGLCVLSGDLIEIIYVTPSRRRQGIAKGVLASLLGRENPPRDAYALPGDRATKSLYESARWKARLLTMRGD